MTPKTRKQLLVLVGLVAVAIALALRPTGTPPPETPGAAAGGTARTADAGGVPAVPDVRIDELTAGDSRATTRAPARDPFRFRPAPPPPRPPTAAVAPLPVDPPPAFVPPVQQTPPIPLRFIGVVEGMRSAGGPIGVFAATPVGRGVVFHGKQGDVIDGRYRVLRVGPESAEVAYLDGTGRQTFRMSGR